MLNPAGDAGGLSGALSLHNALRARHGAPPLAWAGDLAAAAQQWADRCVFEHSGPGENLAQYFDTPEAAVQARLCSLLLFAPPCLLPLPACLRSCWLSRCHARRRRPTTPPPSHHQLTPQPHHHHTTTKKQQAWYDEIRAYSYSSGDYSASTGHATQLLWRASARLGCGWAPGCRLLVCRYDPPGNVIGQFHENVFAPTAAGSA